MGDRLGIPGVVGILPFATLHEHKGLWRNGSASDSRSEGCVFESRRAHTFVNILGAKLAWGIFCTVDGLSMF